MTKSTNSARRASSGWSITWSTNRSPIMTLVNPPGRSMRRKNVSLTPSERVSEIGFMFDASSAARYSALSIPRRRRGLAAEAGTEAGNFRSRQVRWFGATGGRLSGGRPPASGPPAPGLWFHPGSGVMRTAAGAAPAAGGHAYGPAYYAGLDGAPVPVTALGIATAIAAGAIARGAALQVTAVGKVETHAGNNAVVARALTPAAADGDKLAVMVIPN